MKLMKVVLAFSAFAAIPAFADVNTICQGGGARGNDIKIEITDAPGDLKLRVNDELTSAQREGQVGSVLTYTFSGNSKVFAVEYDYMNATAELRGPAPTVKLFCSRGL